MGTEYARTQPGSLHKSSAPLDYRLALRLPPLAALVRRWFLRLPPSSRIRQALVTRSVQLAFSAYERGDFVSPLRLFYAPDLVMESGEMLAAAPDLPQVVHGREALAQWLETWHEPFAWIRWEVTELLDFDDAVVFTVHQEGQGRASGATAGFTVSSAVRWRDGLVVWQRFFRTRDDAIRAIGRDPAEIEPAKRD